MTSRRDFLKCAVAAGTSGSLLAEGTRSLIQSRQSGRWSSPATWAGGSVPMPGARVHVAAGHRVIFDAVSKAPFRAVFLSGTLSFDVDRDTCLDTGLIRIGGGLMEDGANMNSHEPSHAGTAHFARRFGQHAGIPGIG
jgi:G8 domain